MCEIDYLAREDFPQNAAQEAVRIDPYLDAFSGHIADRLRCTQQLLRRFDADGGLLAVSNSYTTFGLHQLPDMTTCLEWAPNAVSMTLTGDFNDWSRTAHPFTPLKYGAWKLELPHRGGPAIASGSRLKLHMRTRTGECIDRISPWANYVVQNESTQLFEWVHLHEDPCPMQHPRPPIPPSLRIYEAHVGIASPEPKIASYDEFRTNVLPRVAAGGYNCVQLMAIMEHAYYASFGYQITSFFAPSSRYGTPGDLRRLIDAAHGLGLIVVLDVVHSHASKNTLDGLNAFDGSTSHFFHGDAVRGTHPVWDSRLFDYANYETLRFLLSNIAYYMCEFSVDGFRFDGVTSMLYHHHGVCYGFSGDYHEYFSQHTDLDACAYLTLANMLVHAHRGVSIAEDVSGMPTLCRPVASGGFGFDYRLAMAAPDLWVKLLKTERDEDWNMEYIAHVLTNRRHLEKTVAYAESHDQALVGDKTIAFWLMDAEMYTNMSIYSPFTPTIARGIALHTMIRLVTFALAGESYMNFIGNEFGHPEWLDFPRAGNGSSFHYCRRQFNLADDPLLRYQYLLAFDRPMLALDDAYGLLASPQAYFSLKHNSDKVLVFERANLLFAFNFHPSSSFADYRIPVLRAGRYRIVLNSDDPAFLGHNRIDTSVLYISEPVPYACEANSIKVYLPSRTALVFEHEQ